MPLILRSIRQYLLWVSPLEMLNIFCFAILKDVTIRLFGVVGWQYDLLGCTVAKRCLHFYCSVSQIQVSLYVDALLVANHYFNLYFCFDKGRILWQSVQENIGKRSVFRPCQTEKTGTVKSKQKKPWKSFFTK